MNLFFYKNGSYVVTIDEEAKDTNSESKEKESLNIACFV